MLSKEDKELVMATALDVIRDLPPYRFETGRDLLLLVDDYNQSVPKLDYLVLRARVQAFLETLTETETGPDDWPEYAELLEALDAS